jgi:hypothetical protein
MRNTLMTCCLLFSLFCGASVARAGELTTHLQDRHCAQLKGDLAQYTGCSNYWKYRIEQGLDRVKALQECKNSCSIFNAYDPCEYTCKGMSKIDN